MQLKTILNYGIQFISGKLINAYKSKCEKNKCVEKINSYHLNLVHLVYKKSKLSLPYYRCYLE